MTLGNLIVKLSASTSQFHADMQAAARRINQVAREITKSGREISVAISLPLIAAGFLAFRAALEDSQKAFGPLAHQFTAMKAQIHDMWVAIGQALAPTFIQLIHIVGQVVEWVRHVVDAFNKLSPGMKTAIVDTLLFLAALGPTIFALGKLVAVVAAVPGVLAGIVSPIGLTIIAALALAAAALLIITNWDKVKLRLLLFWTAIEEAFFDGVNAILGLFATLTKWIPGLGKAMGDLRDQFAASSDKVLAHAAVQIQLAENADKTTRALHGQAKAVEDLSKFFRNLKTAVDAVKAAQLEDLTKLFQGLKTAIDGVKDSAIAAAAADWAKLTAGVRGVVEALKAADITSTAAAFTKIVDQIKAGLTAVKAEAAGRIASINDVLQQGLVDGLTAVAQQMGNILAGAGGSFKQFGAAILGVLGQTMVTLGKMLIGFGIAGLAIKRFITNPFGAIAAGVALIALGSALAGAAQGTVDNAGAGGGGGGSTAAVSSPSGPSQDANGTLTIIFPGKKVLDPSDPDFQDVFAQMMGQVQQRNVVVVYDHT